MELNEEKRKFINKRVKEYLELLARRELDPTKKLYMTLALQVLRITDTLEAIARQYSKFENKNNSYEEAKQILEYLQLVEGGMNLFLNEIGYYDKEKRPLTAWIS